MSKGLQFILSKVMCLKLVQKKLKDARCSNTIKVWHLPATTDNMFRFKVTLKNDHITEKSSSTMGKVNAFVRYPISKRYSEITIKTYNEALLTFLKFYNQKLLNDITSDDIILFNNDYIVKKNLSASYQNQIVNALELLFAQIENTKIDIDLIHRPKKYNSLPKVLAMEEVAAIINVLTNSKHKCMISLIYAARLRRGKLLS